MPKFKVEMTRIGYGFATIEVDAQTESEAHEKAMDTAGDHSYSEKSSDYEVQSVVCVEEG